MTRPIALDLIREARERIADAAVRTPLVRLNLDAVAAEIYLKLENLQPIGSFKIRGAANAMAVADPRALAGGVYTASAGNMGQGVAWNARRRGIPCRVIVPDRAPRTKVDAIERLGGEVISRPFADWWKVIVDHGDPEIGGHFIHPVSDPDVIAGNGTIGLEILEDLPDVDTVVVPYGGGGLACGIASAIRAIQPGVEIFAAEVETAAPLKASLDAGAPQQIEYLPSFVDGIGSPGLLDDMWLLASELLAGSLVVALDQVAAAVRTMVERNRVVAEGAGAAGVAAALAGMAGSGKVVCVISGGNLDSEKLRTILAGGVP